MLTLCPGKIPEDVLNLKSEVNVGSQSALDLCHCSMAERNPRSSTGSGKKAALATLA